MGRSPIHLKSDHRIIEGGKSPAVRGRMCLTPRLNRSS
jgi:hypothetical protein